jgi:hypothetical protein
MLTEEEKKARRAAYQKAYREANKEEIAAYNKAYNKAYKEANKEEIAAYHKAYQKAYREANKEEIAAYNKAYREANKEKIVAYREANKEKFKGYFRAYSRANPEKVAKEVRKRRARKLAAYVPRCSYWESVEKEIMEERERLRETGVVYHIDHIYPLAKGGIDHPINYQLLTPEENRSKKDKVDKSCPVQMRMKEISKLVLKKGMDIDSALKLTEENK